MDRLTLYSFSPEQPFADCLAAWLDETYGHDSLKLAETLLLLPSRRACLSVRDAFLRRAVSARLLPRLQPLADIDEGALLAESWLDESPYFAPAIAPSLRQVLLTRLVHEANPNISVEQAALLAAELARLKDEMDRAEVDFAALESLVPAELATHWQKTMHFLNLVRYHWPKLRDGEGWADPIARRNALLRRQAERWAETPPPYPVIAAGSTGSQPATAALLRVVAALPGGAVILPGLDTAMPGEEWEALGPTHPQWGIRQLLQDLGVKRKEVQVLGGETHARTQLLAASMAPAEFTARWRETEIATEALTGVERIDCDHPREEARAIALRLRHALETPGARAAVVTQDRALARMVAAEMRRFDVEVDDSAGTELLAAPPAVFMRLLAEAALSRAAPVPLLALLKHPLATAGFATQAECREAARELERHVLRGMRPREGLENLMRAVPLSAAEAVMPLLHNAEELMGGFMRLAARKKVPFAELLEAHVKAGEGMAAGLWAGEAGEALSLALSELGQAAPRLPAINPNEYPGLLETLLAGKKLRPAYGTHPRLHILSPIEARLQHFDVMILAGLNEGSWPREAEPSPWLSRPMAAAFGLPAPEESVGKSAHDFFMAACAPQVVLTRSRKTGGTAASPARWLTRLDALLSARGNFAWPPSPYLAWARNEDALAPLRITQPAPCPPAAARPTRLSVTEIEKWQRDPYMIYARHVLGLRRMDELDEEPDIREFGQIVHKALDLFARTYPEKLPDNAEASLLAIAGQVFSSFSERPAVAAFWQPRFAAAVPWLIEQERKRRQDITQLLTEQKKEWNPVPGFTLVTSVDRLEQHADGTHSIIDYKTGAPPEQKDIKAGVAAQLPLEALVMGIENPRELAYWKLAAERSEVKELEDPAALCAQAGERLKALIEAFGREDMPYLACPDMKFKPRYNDYEHLERHEEWEWQREEEGAQ